MAGKAKSDAAKRRDASDEREALVVEAIELAKAERDKPRGEPRLGLRAVCRHVETLHHERTNRWIRIDHSTVSRRLNGGRSIRDFNETKCLVTPEETDILIAYAIECACRGFPIDYRRLAEHANELLRVRLGPDFPGVGENWPSRFVERNSDKLDMYWSAALDSQRGRAVNPTANAAYWKIAGGTISDNSIKPRNLYASDEAAFTTSLHTKKRVIGPRIKTASVQHQQTGGNRENMTVLDTICADGRTLPPVVIYKGEHFLVKWKQNNPLNASLGYSKKGWMTGEISVEWIKHFDDQTREIADGDDRLLFVDGHVTHYTRGFLEYAKAHRIHVLCYPAHATHVYQGLDVVLFGPLKKAYSDERERWENEKHAQVSKATFLEVYSRAHQRVMTPENVRAAFRKTGLCPFDPSVVTPEMMAPSRETSSQAHMPLPQPTPVRLLADMLRLRDPRALDSVTEGAEQQSAPTSPQLTPRARGSAQRGSSIPAQPESDEPAPAYPFPIDPILFTTPYQAGQATAAAHGPSVHTTSPAHRPRSEQRTAAEQSRGPRAPDPTPRTTLRATSAAFLVDPEPLTSGMRLPAGRAVVPPEWDGAAELLEIEPQTELEERLQQMLRTAADVHEQQLAACYVANATMVLQASYCERVRGQLAAAEKKARKSKSHKLLADGMPHLLTGDEFMARVEGHHEAQQVAAAQKEQRKADRARYDADMKDWTRKEDARKARNAAKTAAYKASVAEWEAARALAKLEHRRCPVKKPVRGPLEKAVPKPRARALPDVEEEDTEDFAGALDEVDEQESDDD